MQDNPSFRARRRPVPRPPLLPLLLVAIAFGITSGSALAGRLTDMPAPNVPAAGNAGQTPDKSNTAPSSPLDHAFMTIEGSLTDFGSLPVNPNSGDAVTTGDRFVLDLFVHAQDHSGSAMQAYVTYTNPLADVADVNNLPNSCILVQTAKADPSTMDSTLQNEWCNGPADCTFRGVQTPAGWGAYAAGALNSCPAPNGCPGDYRVAQIGWCAFQPGTFTIHWQFSPPDPVTRDTEIVDSNSQVVSNPALFTDYTITIVGAPVATVTTTNTPLP